MTEQQIRIILKRKFDDIATGGKIDPTTRFNVFKEELQYYILNFIYHHPEYSKWIMYGGSALRIIHGLDRMSVDLDFEIPHAITDKFLEELKKEVENHFVNTYGAGADFITVKITNGRGLLLKFHIGDELSAGHASKQVHVKIDINKFVAPKTVTERWPINRGQLSFVIATYNMSALMASKIAAIFLRDQRGVDKNIYDYKGRDIYDLLWYMEKKIVPDFDYLNAKLKEKGFETQDIKKLFDKLTVNILNYPKMDNLLRDDLSHLFENPFQFEGWFKNWRESYLRLLKEYEINTITKLESVEIHHDFHTDNFYFIYRYKTEEGGFIRVMYVISDYWIEFRDGDLSLDIDNAVSDIIKFTSNGTSNKPVSEKKLKQYATLFYNITEKYFKKTNRVMLGDNIVTKIIRMTAENFNPKEQILINKSSLINCELDTLLK